MIISSKTVKLFDPAGMYHSISEFPAQVEEAVEIGTESRLAGLKGRFSAIVMAGMGGSAIGGDLLRSYASQELAVPFVVSRSYVLPEFVNSSTLVIVSSYSGNTEETLEAYTAARAKRAIILCLTTGGKVHRIAKKNGDPVISIIPGLQPRAAVGYSFFPLLIAFIRLGLLKKRDGDLAETIGLLWRLSRRYGDYRSTTNRAIGLASALHGKLPIIYSATDHLDAINVRWRSQLSENAKQLAYGHVLPELNHNEIVGWDVNPNLMKKTAVVFLKDRGIHRRVRRREAITESIVRRHAGAVLEAASEGSSLLARMFSLVHLGDWVSYYLALLNRRNPTPVTVIEHLKGEISKA